MTYHDLNDAAYIQKFDVENRLVAITHELAFSAIADPVTLSVTQFIYPANIRAM